MKIDRLKEICKNFYSFLEYTIRCLYYYIIIKKFNDGDSLEKLVDAVLEKWKFILRPIQVKWELLTFLKLVKENKPVTVLEVGTANGGTLFLFSRLASEKAHIICIDFPMGFWGKAYSLVRNFFFRTLPGSGQKLNLLWENSQIVETQKKVAELLKGKKIDLLHIDADHSYQGVKKDFELYSPFVKEDGLIAFHDIVYHPPGTVSHPAQVDIFWNEIKTKHQHLEIVKDWGQWWAGIGLITKKTFFGKSLEETSKFLDIPESISPSKNESFIPIIKDLGIDDLKNDDSEKKRNKAFPKMDHKLSIPLYNYHSQHIKFNCSRNNLTRLDFFIGTYKRKTPGILILEIYKDDSYKNPIRGVGVNSSDLKDNKFTSFVFEPIENKTGEIIFISLTLKDGIEGHFPGLWYGLKRS